MPSKPSQSIDFYLVTKHLSNTNPTFYHEFGVISPALKFLVLQLKVSAL